MRRICCIRSPILHNIRTIEIQAKWEHINTDAVRWCSAKILFLSCWMSFWMKNRNFEPVIENRRHVSILVSIYAAYFYHAKIQSNKDLNFTFFFRHFKCTGKSLANVWRERVRLFIGQTTGLDGGDIKYLVFQSRCFSAAKLNNGNHVEIFLMQRSLFKEFEINLIMHGYYCN